MEARGEGVTAWTVANDMDVVNDAASLPTFETVNGRSWVDLTMVRGADAVNWSVCEDETLSDHRAISFQVTAVGTRVTALW